MTITQDDLKTALGYANRLKITSSIDTSDARILQFHWSEPLPSGLTDEAEKLLDIAVQYYQRTVFTGEYLAEDNNPPVRKSGDRIEDINYYLEHYKPKLITEIKKAFGFDENRKKTITEEGRIMTPYAEAMLEYQKKLKDIKKK